MKCPIHGYEMNEASFNFFQCPALDCNRLWNRRDFEQKKLF